MAIKVQKRNNPYLHCAFCREPLGQEAWICFLCSVRLHRSCRTELAGCPTIGCRQNIHQANRQARRRRPRQERARRALPINRPAAPVVVLVGISGAFLLAAFLSANPGLVILGVIVGIIARAAYKNL